MPTTWLKLTVIMLAATTSIRLAMGQAQRQPTVIDIPPDLLPIIQKDFGTGSPAVASCLKSSGRAFEHMVRTRWLALNRSQRPALLVEGLVPCLAGNDNGTKLVYSRVGNDWRKIFEGVGDTLELAKTSTNGWRDVVLWQHDDAYRRARQLSGFDGTQYKSVSCTLVRLTDEITHQKLVLPRYESCPEEFLAMRPQ